MKEEPPTTWRDTGEVAMTLICFPGWFVAELARKSAEVAKELLQSQGQVTSEDAKNISEIIKSGAEAGVKKMRVKISREGAVGFDAAQGKSKASAVLRTTIGVHGSAEYDVQVEYA